MTSRRRRADSPGFWLVIAAVLVANAAVTVAVVDGGALPFAVSILGFALVSIVNALRLVRTEHGPVEHS